MLMVCYLFEIKNPALGGAVFNSDYLCVTITYLLTLFVRLGKTKLMKNIIALLMLLLFCLCEHLTANAQSNIFTCFQKNYGEGAGWEKANFKIKIDMDNYKISIHDPKIEEFIHFSSNAYSVNDKTTLLTGSDQSGIPVKVFITLSDPPTLTVLYLNTSIGQIYKLKSQ